MRDKSKTVNWEMYLGSPNQQIINGWKIDTFRPGDQVRVDAYPARNGSNLAYARKVTKSTAR